jgi:hypothetical protein
VPDGRLEPKHTSNRSRKHASLRERSQLLGVLEVKELILLSLAFETLSLAFEIIRGNKTLSSLPLEDSQAFPSSRVWQSYKSLPISLQEHENSASEET